MYEACMLHLQQALPGQPPRDGISALKALSTPILYYTYNEVQRSKDSLGCTVGERSWYVGMVPTQHAHLPISKVAVSSTLYLWRRVHKVEV